MGKPLITVCWKPPISARTLYSTHSNVYSKYLGLSKVCSYIPEPCYGQVYTFPGYNTSREFWNAPLIIDLMKYMRDSYSKKEQFKYNIDQFSYENMGQEYVELLVS